MLIINSTYHPPLKYTMSFMSIVSLHIEATKSMGLCHHHLNLLQSKERNNTRWTTYEIVNYLVAHLQHAPEKVTAFYIQNPGAPRKVSAVIHASLPWQFHTDLTEINVDVDPLGGG